MRCPPRRGPNTAAPAAAAAVGLACAADPVAVRDVGPAEACESFAAWPEDATAAEDALAERLVVLRDATPPCADPGAAPPPPLAAAAALRCAARRHALDLAARKTLEPTGGDGSTPVTRAAEAAYDRRLYYEIRAADFRAAGQVSDALLADDVACAALADPAVTDVGVGARRSDDGAFIAWVVLLGGPFE